VALYSSGNKTTIILQAHVVRKPTSIQPTMNKNDLRNDDDNNNNDRDVSTRTKPVVVYKRRRSAQPQSLPTPTPTKRQRPKSTVEANTASTGDDDDESDDELPVNATPVRSRVRRVVTPQTSSARRELPPVSSASAPIAVAPRRCWHRETGCCHATAPVATSTLRRSATTRRSLAVLTVSWRVL
jgi:hypothetical protein